MAGRQIVLKNCRYVIADAENILENVDILVEDGVIVSVSRGLGGGEEIDCRKKIAIPGLVNAHTHAAMWALRGLFDRGELFDWLKNVWSVEELLTPRLIYLASKAAFMEMLMNGVTAVVDMYFEPLQSVKAAEETGIRLYTGPVLSELSYEESQSHENTIRRILELARKEQRVGLVINVHSAYTTHERVLRYAAELARKHSALLVTHASETRDEVFEIKNREGLFPVEYLDRLGFLGEKTGLVHLGWITSWEVELLKRKRTTAIHCPSSNMKLATGGFFPLKEMLDMGINVVLGTDGPASNNTLDIFREMRVAVLLNRHNYWNTDIGAEDAFRMATLNGYKFLGLKGGAITPESIADLVLLNSGSPRLRPLTRRNVLSNLVYSASGADVYATIVAGKIVYTRENADYYLASIEEIAKEIEEFTSTIDLRGSSL